MERGVVVCSVAGFFFVDNGGELILCRARGRLKQKGISPLAGDLVCYSADGANSGLIEEILPRHNLLTRPAVANIDGVVSVAAVEQPAPDLLLMDKILALAQYMGLAPMVCINKEDLAPLAATELGGIYQNAGYQTVVCSALSGAGIDQLSRMLAGKTVVLAGQSGVGKSHIVTRLTRPWPDLAVQLGKISAKGRRGRHTTRQVTLLRGKSGGRIADTPGFSTMIPDIPSADLAGCFPDLARLAAGCRFNTCLHVQEPGCAVKQSVDAGKLNQIRYQNYLRLFEQIKAKEGSRY